MKELFIAIKKVLGVILLVFAIGMVWYVFADCGTSGTSTETPTPTATSEPTGEATTPDLDAELAFLSRAIDLETLIVESSECFSGNSTANSKATRLIKRGVAQWTDDWSTSTCPSEEMRPLYNLTRKLSKTWCTVCRLYDRFLDGTGTADAVTQELMKGIRLQEQLTTMVEEWSAALD
jgi:hypothetical protein